MVVEDRVGLQGVREDRVGLMVGREEEMDQKAGRVGLVGVVVEEAQ